MLPVATPLVIVAPVGGRPSAAWSCEFGTGYSADLAFCGRALSTTDEVKPSVHASPKSLWRRVDRRELQVGGEWRRGAAGAEPLGVVDERLARVGEGARHHEPSAHDEAVAHAGGEVDVHALPPDGPPVLVVFTRDEVGGRDRRDRIVEAVDDIPAAALQPRVEWRRNRVRLIGAGVTQSRPPTPQPAPIADVP